MSARGRRPGSAEATREAILAAARLEFAQKGYDGASLRGIARAAAVDPALVHHYFAGKADVFGQALALPVNIPEQVRALLGGPWDRLGDAVIRTFLSIWDRPEASVRLQAVLRASVATPAAGHQLREFILREVVEPITRHTGVPEPQLRAAAAAAQLLGIALLRYVVPHPPLAGASHDAIAALVGPTLQRYLVGEQPTAAPPDTGDTGALRADRPPAHDSSHGE
ncbi:MAG: TetR family transcriptional regulator [Austwickia sp.]|nr:TetR family transcriptional regulator [Actinomycetota bacterium]MCO5308745.1 TetR family transcriptional regulator [Austwickia sp.]